MSQVVSLGKFDALHLGHFALAERAATLGSPMLLGLVGMAEAFGWPARLPLVAAHDRMRILATWSNRLGRPVQFCALPFAQIRHLDPLAFVQLLKKSYDVVAVVVGQDFRFGRDRIGDAALLVRLGAECGLKVDLVPPVQADGRSLSSSLVRRLLAEGAVTAVQAALGRPYRLCGKVVHGKQLGRTLGFPTANCGRLENQPPGPGVYAGWAYLDHCTRLPAAIAVGHAPTVAADLDLVAEAHFLDWNGDCYDAHLGLEFTAFLRPELRFPDLPTLVRQMRLDVEDTRRRLRPSPMTTVPLIRADS